MRRSPCAALQGRKREQCGITGAVIEESGACVDDSLRFIYGNKTFGTVDESGAFFDLHDRRDNFRMEKRKIVTEIMDCPVSVDTV